MGVPLPALNSSMLFNFIYANNSLREKRLVEYNVPYEGDLSSNQLTIIKINCMNQTRKMLNINLCQDGILSVSAFIALKGRAELFISEIFLPQ